jgi:hypothetical protein
MKATLEFTLPDEDHEFRMAQDGGKWMLVLCDVLERLRTARKYNDKDDFNIEEMEKFIWDGLDDRGLRID